MVINSIGIPKHHIETVGKDFEFFTSVVSKLEKQLHQQEELKCLWNRVIEAAYNIHAWCCLCLSTLSHIILPSDELKCLDEHDLPLNFFSSSHSHGLWNIQVWHDFCISFPDDETGSRIIFTSKLPQDQNRFKYLAVGANAAGIPESIANLLEG